MNNRKLGAAGRSRWIPPPPFVGGRRHPEPLFDEMKLA